MLPGPLTLTRFVRSAQVFGVTQDPFIVYTSNLFAILSLRGLYSFVAGIMGELRFLNKAVALVLGFVGEHFVLSWRHPRIPPCEMVAGITGELRFLNQAVALVRGFVAENLNICSKQTDFEVSSGIMVKPCS